MCLEYKTVKTAAEDEFTEKRSRFIGNICPVETVEEANAFIEKIKKTHYNARHNCFAYILRDGNIKRYSDDGEPQGTAGTPILHLLEKEEITDAVIVVTRYFGGILLGTGGLTRAYGHAAKLALQKGEIKRMGLCSILKLKTDYAFYQRLLALFKETDVHMQSEEFMENVTLTFSVPAEREAFWIKTIYEQSEGKITAQKISQNFAEI